MWEKAFGMRMSKLGPVYGRVFIFMEPSTTVFFVFVLISKNQQISKKKSTPPSTKITKLQNSLFKHAWLQMAY